MSDSPTQNKTKRHAKGSFVKWHCVSRWCSVVPQRGSGDNWVTTTGTHLPIQTPTRKQGTRFLTLPKGLYSLSMTASLPYLGMPHGHPGIRNASVDLLPSFVYLVYPRDNVKHLCRGREATAARRSKSNSRREDKRAKQSSRRDSTEQRAARREIDTSSVRVAREKRTEPHENQARREKQKNNKRFFATTERVRQTVTPRFQHRNQHIWYELAR